VRGACSMARSPILISSPLQELSAINEILNVQRSELQQRIEVLSDEVSFKESELARERTKAKEDAEQHERQARLLEAANKKIENLQRQNEAQVRSGSYDA